MHHAFRSIAQSRDPAALPTPLPAASAADFWHLFTIAALLRDTFKLHGGERADGVTIVGDAQEALMFGLDSLVKFARLYAESV